MSTTSSPPESEKGSSSMSDASTLPTPVITPSTETTQFIEQPEPSEPEPKPTSPSSSAAQVLARDMAALKVTQQAASTPSLQASAAPTAPKAPSRNKVTAGGTRLGGLGGPGRHGIGLGSSKVPPALAAKMAAMTNRQQSGSGAGMPSLRADQRLDPSAFMAGGGAPSPVPGPSLPRGLMSPGGRMSPGSPAGGLKARKGPGLTLGAMGMSPAPPGRIGSSGPAGGGQRLKPSLNLGGLGGPSATPFSNFSKIVDPSGRLNFGGKAVLHANGVDFSNGSSFAIQMSELTLMEELGKGNYGTVQKVFHKPTKVVMAMKEIRLELDDSKLKAILTELDILHRGTSDTIVEFYGAFFIESCVYYCMEYMDAGSLDKLAGAHVPEPVLARVTRTVVEGLRFLKDELQTMHRDVKPTNILMNGAGEAKLCDFGVSGQLERSLAKTNIGCQSYMAPERIQGEHQGQLSTYTVASDVWSLGLSVIEFAAGHYPYPPETYSNIFAQLTALVYGPAPTLPAEYSAEAQDLVAQCLRKNAEQRPTYAQLLRHPFLAKDIGRDVDMRGWVKQAIEEVKGKKAAGLTSNGVPPSPLSNSTETLSSSSHSSTSGTQTGVALGTGPEILVKEVEDESSTPTATSPAPIIEI